jgi:branched-chain amino acid transport system substrate-binding protein
MKLTRRDFAAGIAAGIAAPHLIGSARAQGATIKIGMCAPITGPAAEAGKYATGGAKLALEMINKKGGVLGKQIKLLVEDDQSKPEEAGTAVTKLINQDHVVAMLGHVASSHSLAAAPICQSNKVPMITPSSTNPRVTQVGDYIFRVCFTDTFTGEVVAKFVYDTLKAKKIAILVDVRSDYSVGLQTFFGEAFKRRGGEIVANQSYSQGDSDFRAQLTQIKATNPDAIYVPGYYTEVGTIVHQGRELGITVPFVGSDGWDSPKLWEIGGEALNGCYFSNHYSTDDPNPAVQKFVNDYKTKYGQVPDALAALAYDAARILADSFTRAGSTDGDKVRKAIGATKDFPGVTGAITINAERNAVKPAVILKVENGKYLLVETITPEAVKQ